MDKFITLHIQFPQPPTTSADTTATKMTSTQKVSTAKTSSATTTTTTASQPTAILSPATHRPHTVFAPISLLESLTKTNLLLVADMKSKIQSIHNELSSIPLENIRNEQSQNFGNLSDKIEALEKKLY